MYEWVIDFVRDILKGVYGSRVLDTHLIAFCERFTTIYMRFFIDMCSYFSIYSSSVNTFMLAETKNNCIRSQSGFYSYSLRPASVVFFAHSLWKKLVIKKKCKVLLNQKILLTFFLKLRLVLLIYFYKTNR